MKLEFTQKEKDFVAVFEGEVQRNIHRIRKQLRLTHREVAKGLHALTGCSPCHTSSRAAEIAEGLPYTKLLALAMIFGCKIEDFFKLEPEVLKETNNNGLPFAKQEFEFAPLEEIKENA